jgi:lysophospholipase L1-like esterase
VPALERAYPSADIRLRALGRNGFDTVLAAFDAQSVVAEQPDLVIIEFSINDQSPAIRPLIVPALLGIMSQVRAARPDCEFIFTYLTRAGDAVAGGAPEVRIHDALAELAGIPSIDLAGLSAELVASGAATYQGGSDHALTRDGVHHTPAAARLLGEPFGAALAAVVAAGSPDGRAAALPTLAGAQAELGFAAAFRFDAQTFGKLMTDRFDLSDHQNLDPERYVDLVYVSGPDPAPLWASPTLFERARRTTPRDFLAAGDWAIGRAKYKVENLSHNEDLLVAVGAGATLRFPACGSFACFTGFASGGTLAVRIDGRETVVRPPALNANGALQHWPLIITNGLQDRRHAIDIVADGSSMAFSDIFYVEPPAEER